MRNPENNRALIIIQLWQILNQPKTRKAKKGTNECCHHYLDGLIHILFSLFLILKHSYFELYIFWSFHFFLHRINCTQSILSDPCQELSCNKYSSNDSSTYNKINPKFLQLVTATFGIFRNEDPNNSPYKLLNRKSYLPSLHRIKIKFLFLLILPSSFLLSHCSGSALFC